MNGVLVFAVLRFFAGHNDKIPFARVNDLYVMYGKTCVECDG